MPFSSRSPGRSCTLAKGEATGYAADEGGGAEAGGRGGASDMVMEWRGFTAVKPVEGKEGDRVAGGIVGALDREPL